MTWGMAEGSSPLGGVAERTGNEAAGGEMRGLGRWGIAGRRGAERRRAAGRRGAELQGGIESIHVQSKHMLFAALRLRRRRRGGEATERLRRRREAGSASGGCRETSYREVRGGERRGGLRGEGDGSKLLRTSYGERSGELRGAKRGAAESDDGTGQGFMGGG